MDCPYCGTTLPDDARFCSQCGKLMDRPARELARGYETCRILLWGMRVRTFGRSSWRFTARTIGSGMPALVAESAPFLAQTRVRWHSLNRRSYADPPLDPAQQAALADLIGQLEREGWEPIGHAGLGHPWYEQWFRRCMGAVSLASPRLVPGD